ncbi:cytochrome P450 734A1-like protein [Salvia divinorum]|uniref:Cytochrome P450 734A1-like protein n=1 Tax=Salvia divinorum TaxID=28513 RepID=A0ABD1H4H1_SALDI
MENLKLIAPIMAETMEESLVKLSENMNKIGSLEVEIEVSVWFQNLLEDVITKITFGKNYEEGLVISKLQAHQTAHATEAYQNAFIPGYRFLPTSASRVSRQISKEIRKYLLKLIDRRRRSDDRSHDESSSNDRRPTDLLEVMMNAAGKSPRRNGQNAVTDDDVVEECKTIFFAGTHTTSAMLTWTAVLLAMHSNWQDEARDEIFRVCGARDAPPTKDDLAKLKLLGMIINESVRLYPPVVAMIRRAKEDVFLGGIRIPKDTEILIPTIAVHHDSTLWGDDVRDFNPGRFAEGVSQAVEHPMAYLPFGSGARRCIGQNLAILEAKLVFAMILQRFSLELAPKYRHTPSIVTLLHPQHGAPIVFTKLSNYVKL